MIDEIIKAVKKNGDILLFAQDPAGSASSKEGRANYVTKYDVAVQQSLQEALLKIMPEAAFVGEECGCQAYNGKGWAFIVDPIDGTTNFMKNFRHSCLSVAAAKDGEVVMGVVYNPYTKELFRAIKDGGAFLNNEPIHAAAGHLAEELVTFGTSPYYEELIDQTFEMAKKLHRASLDVRRSGSAALDLCDIAAGRSGLFFEYRLQPWDFAAGSLIASEAGALVGQMDGSPLQLGCACSVLAAGPQAWEDYFSLDAEK